MLKKPVEIKKFSLTVPQAPLEILPGEPRLAHSKWCDKTTKCAGSV